MGRRLFSVSGGFAVAFAIFFSVSSSPSFPIHFHSKYFSDISLSTSRISFPPPRNLASDLLSLLGTKRDAAAVEPLEARRLSSCLRFLVPFAPSAKFYSCSAVSWKGPFWRRSFLDCCGNQEENELVWWPPESVMELARVAAYSGGDPDAVRGALDPSMLTIPDVEGLKKDKCQLTKTPYGRRFTNEDLNKYLAFLFELVAARGPLVGLNVSLNRYDLFHGHIFLATRTGRLGILFHAREYPAFDTKIFPYNMGYCQTGSCLGAMITSAERCKSVQQESDTTETQHLIPIQSSSINIASVAGNVPACEPPILHAEKDNVLPLGSRAAVNPSDVTQPRQQ